jgi:lipopolysaccharide/colanic/teichoic acid biosynthesis glycosyltransferase
MADHLGTERFNLVELRRSNYADSKIKRIFDLLFAAIILIASSPILIPLTLLNTIVTGGHPIFVQRRVGKDGVEFGLLKLRTMRIQQDGEEWSHRTEKVDNRLTSVGRLIRQSYFDELPQLINVLLGQMSMIGPRPETLEMTREISAVNPRFEQRMSVKPGITGTAQIFFRKPESDHDLWRRYYYDRLYISQSSLLFDVRIACLTVWHILRHKGH